MAIKQLAADENSNHSQLPYLNEYLESLTPSQLKKALNGWYLVESFKFPTSGKGVLINTHEFTAFQWKKGAVYQVFTEYLEQSENFALMVQPIDSSGKSIRVAIDDEIPVSLGKTGKEPITYSLSPLESGTVSTEKEF